MARSFEQISKVEKFHEARYRKLIENVTKKEVFKKDKAVKWHCINCGYIFEGAKASEALPGLPASPVLLRGPGREFLNALGVRPTVTDGLTYFLKALFPVLLYFFLGRLFCGSSSGTDGALPV